MSEKLTRQLIQQKTPIELCFTSNVLTKTINSHHLHPFSNYHNHKHPIAVSCDDRGVFGISLTHEYQLIRDTFALSESDLCHLASNAVDFSFCNNERKNHLRKLFDSFS